ncbi:DEAD/DEAH box helicase family protein [Streptacidiphilus melanogenes]|uniref:DEAD/DEAH box helicase family protein n=1 Tax=Streptacidiphilus melanogenes TaxID=411235 RepID=UPI0005AA513C|nr:DEAD/DEAH box helicase family protein [Streptacidiphilus melanogenes]
MIPPHYDRASTPPGEREVFERLRDDPATGDWIALHSLAVADHPRQIQGEVDFVVLVPGVGMLCLEVKSHLKVDRLSDGQWKLGSHRPEARGPFVQADEAKFAVEGQLRKASPRLPPLPVTSAVCFTHARFQVPNPTEWHSWQSVDAVAFHRTPISALVLGILKGYRDHLAATPNARSWFSPGSAEPTAATCARALDILRPSFEFAEPPKLRRYRREEEAQQFTQHQYRVLDMLAENPRCIIKGPAGTGKTFLAVEAARRLAADGARVLLCCYNKLLGGWLKEETAAEELITAGTLHGFMTQLLPASERQRIVGTDRERWFDEVLPEQALEVLLSDGPRFDALVVDEAQDLMRDTYLDVLDVALHGGLGSGRWLQFGDFTNQAIYYCDGEGIDLLHRRTSSAPTSISLTVNCRNVPAISQYVEETSRLKPGYSDTLRAENNRETRRDWWKTPQEQQKLLVHHLDRLQSDGFAADEVVVLSPRGTTGAAAVCTDPRWRTRLAPLDQPRKGCVGFGTAHAFKGLDAAAVIVTDIESVSDETGEALLYIATSRARDDLTVLARDTARADFRRLLLGE